MPMLCVSIRLPDISLPRNDVGDTSVFFPLYLPNQLFFLPIDSSSVVSFLFYLYKHARNNEWVEEKKDFSTRIFFLFLSRFKSKVSTFISFVTVPCKHFGWVFFF